MAPSFLKSQIGIDKHAVLFYHADRRLRAKLPSAIKEEHLWVKLHLPAVC